MRQDLISVGFASSNKILELTFLNLIMTDTDGK